MVISTFLWWYESLSTQILCLFRELSSGFASVFTSKSPKVRNILSWSYLSASIRLSASHIWTWNYRKGFIKYRFIGPHLWHSFLCSLNINLLKLLYLLTFPMTQIWSPPPQPPNPGPPYNMHGMFLHFFYFPSFKYFLFFHVSFSPTFFIFFSPPGFVAVPNS